MRSKPRMDAKRLTPVRINLEGGKDPCKRSAELSRRSACSARVAAQKRAENCAKLRTSSSDSGRLNACAVAMGLAPTNTTER